MHSGTRARSTAPPTSARSTADRPLAAALSLGSGCEGADEPSGTTVALAKPTSVFCEEQGGEVEIVDEGDGQVGYCLLPDGRRVEEWEYFRSEAGAGAVP